MIPSDSLYFFSNTREKDMTVIIKEEDDFAEAMIKTAQRMLGDLRRAFDAREAERVVESAEELRHQLLQIVDEIEHAGWIEEED